MDLEHALIQLAWRKDELQKLTDLIYENIWLSWKDTGKEYLNLAYEHEYSENDNGDTVIAYKNHNGNIEDYLFKHCKYALKAHQLVQERKVARKALGVAKARITRISNLLYKEVMKETKQKGDLIA